MLTEFWIFYFYSFFNWFIAWVCLGVCLWYALFLKGWCKVRTGDWNLPHGLCLPPAPGLTDAPNPSGWLCFPAGSALNLLCSQPQWASWKALRLSTQCQNHVETKGSSETRTRPFLSSSLLTMVGWVLLHVARDPGGWGYQGISLLPSVWLSFPPTSPPAGSGRDFLLLP